MSQPQPQGREKTCQICKHSFPLADFVESAFAPDGRKNFCKNCNVQYPEEFAKELFERKTDVPIPLEFPDGLTLYRDDHEWLKGKWQQGWDSKRKLLGLPTGFVEVDEKVRGFALGELTILGGRPGMGKDQPLRSNLLTPKGWVTMGEIRVGDKVAGEDGQFYNIIAIHPQGVREVYEVGFSDGTACLCGKEHLWRVNNRNGRQKGWKLKIKTTEELSKNLFRHNKSRRNYSVSYVAPVQFEEKELSLHPYVLGVLLGDGCFQDNIKFTSVDGELVEKVVSLLPEKDCLGGSSGDDYTIKRKQRNNTPSETFVCLDSFGLGHKHSYEKFIPQNYLLGSVAQREALLQGLIDTDGFVEKISCRIEYVTTSPQLRDDVVFLVQSLGGSAKWALKKCHYLKGGMRIPCRDAYRVGITFPTGIIPVSLGRKREWYFSRRRVQEKFIQSISYVGQEETQCITVDNPSGLYVTDGFIVTHNSAITQQIWMHAAEYARETNLTAPTVRDQKHIYVFSLEMSKYQLHTRWMAWQLGVTTAHYRTIPPTSAMLDKIESIDENLSTLPIFYNDESGITCEKIDRILAREEKIRGIGLVIVDYIQFMVGTGNDKERLTNISRDLAMIAKNHTCPVLVLSQLSRQRFGFKTTNWKGERLPEWQLVQNAYTEMLPQMLDLRESGALEQDAHNVMFIHRPWYYLPLNEGRIREDAYLYVAKSREGEVRTYPLRYNLGVFSDWSSDGERAECRRRLRTEN